MLTKWKLILPETSAADKEFSAPLTPKPEYDTLRRILDPLIGGDLEHVAVWADYNDGEKYEALDLFCNENGLLLRLPRNEKATTIYRRANLMGKSAAPAMTNPEDLNYIVGPAVLFSRRVWF
jgi:hypothetical protein